MDTHPVGGEATSNDWATGFYRRYYMAIRTSSAYTHFCERVFGCNLGQHGFSDMTQMGRLREIAQIGPGDRILDLGCGTGAMLEFICAETGASGVGLDFIETAIQDGHHRTWIRRDQLAYLVGDIGSLPFAPASFDVLISIDTLYFTELGRTVGEMRNLIVPGGRMAIFFSQGASPERPIETFPRDTLAPDRTDLAVALNYHGLAYRAWDFTAADYAHAQLKKEILDQLRPDFETEGNLFLYENRMGEAMGVMAAVEAGAHTRYLYLVQS